MPKTTKTTADDPAPDARCPDCGASDRVTWTRAEESFSYGIHAATVELTAIVDRGHCAACDFTFTDWRAEIARDEAVQKHVASTRAVDPQAADYRPTRGKIDKSRHAADSVLRAVDKGGAIQMETLIELLDLLRTKTDYHFHVEVAILPSKSAILKTIDNEHDAKETIRRLKAKP